MPEPYRRLLVHNGDMTSRLEDFHGGPVELEVLHREHATEAYRREVLLRTVSGGEAVEYGAIEIDLAAFDRELRRRFSKATRRSADCSIASTSIIAASRAHSSSLLRTPGSTRCSGCRSACPLWTLQCPLRRR